MARKLISIVIPAYNEETVIEKLGQELRSMMERNNAYDFEVIVVENGSADRTWEKLTALHARDSRFKVVQLSRNFTADGGVAAGLRFCRGDAAVLMDADLQDPPEVVDEFIRRWEQGNDVVYGIIKSRQGVSFLRKLLNKLFYAMLDRATRGAIPKNVTAFRLMDRLVYQQLNAMPESNRFTRGLCSWTGFKQVGIEFDRSERFAGYSKAPFWDILKEALDALFSFSHIPLRMITVLGIFLSFFNFAFLAFQILVAIIYVEEIPGYRTIVFTILMMFGFLFICLGIVGEYIGRIFDEVKRRPVFIVKNQLGLDPEDSPAHGAMILD
jgi:dolichol-phosphate mannosyltransferase